VLNYYFGDMGLLEEAIRDHFELKRKHGADPAELLRQEREAFGEGEEHETAASLTPGEAEAAAPPPGEGEKAGIEAETETVELDLRLLEDEGDDLAEEPTVLEDRGLERGGVEHYVQEEEAARSEEGEARHKRRRLLRRVGRQSNDED